MKALIRLKMHMVKAQALPPSIVEGWMPTAPSERAYDRAMNIAFLGIVAGLLGLEAVQRLYVGAYHVYWPLAGGGFQATFGMVGLFAIHWLRAGCPRERQALMASAIILGFSLAFLRGVAFKNDYAFVGLTLVQASMATHAIWVLREKRLSPLRLRNIRDSWFVLLAGLLAGPMLDLSTHYGPLNDAHIFAFEERLGVRVESLVHALVMLFPFGHDFLDWIYSMTEAIFVVPLLTSRPRANPFVPSLVGVGAIGYGLYALCPAIGIQIAAYYSSLWPAANVAPADFAYLTGFAAFPRNCVPSIHAACAYLMLFNVWRFPVSLRRWVIAFGVLTLFSAIEIGLHWFTDIVIALPYTVATMALVNPDLATNKLVRFKVAGVGYGLTLFWMIGIRENWMGISADSAIEWALIGLTIFVSLMLLRQHDMALGKAATPYRPARRVAAALGH